MSKQKIFIQSCHASLEWDHARLLSDLGFDVHGEFDIGSNQRPKIPGVTDRNSNRDDFDIIILHQVPNYIDVMRDLLQKGKRVVLVAFGQTDTWQFEAMAKLCNEFRHAYVAAYAAKEFRRCWEYGVKDGKLRLIRFAKYLTDFPDWIGDSPFVYASGNDIHNRGHGCGWDKFVEVRGKCSVVLSGKNTNEVGGLGEIPESKMRELMQHAAGFISFGTMPAPIVLTQIEAMCAGCPLVVHDNKMGLREDELDILIEDSTDDVAMQATRLINDESFRRERHLSALESRKAFDVNVIGPMWVELLKEVANA